MPENYFMGLVGVGIGVFMLTMILRRIFEKYSISLPFEQKYSTKSILLWMFRDKEMISRLLVTVLILAGLRIAFLIPLPGINVSALQDLLRRISMNQNMAISSAFFSGAVQRLSVFTLGLMPFISACLLIQFLSIFVPKLRRLSFGGESGRAKISKYSYILTIMLCLWQFYFLSIWLENPARFEGLRIVTMSGWSFRLVCMTSMTAAVVFLLFMAEIINKYGIGNGIAVIIVSSIALRIITAINQIWILSKHSLLGLSPILLIIAFAGIIYVVFNITNRAKVIDLQGGDSKRISLHFRPTIVGNIPISYAQSIILLPATLAAFTSTPWANKLAYFFTNQSIFYPILFSILIFVFTFLYVLVVFDSKYVSNLMNKYGYSFVNQTDESASKIINMIKSKVLIITGLFLVGIALIPGLTQTLWRLPYAVSALMGGTILAATIGVFSDIIKQLEFYKDKKESGISEWGVCYIAFDEIEAKIKGEYLKSKGIVSLVEPLRFTWGMPIRTVVDQYRIYVPGDKREEARNLIR